MSMTTEMSQDLQSETRGPRKADSVVSVQSESEGLKTRRINDTVSAGRLEGLRPRKSWCFTSSLRAGKSWHPSLKMVRQGAFSLTQGIANLFVLFGSLTD